MSSDERREFVGVGEGAVAPYLAKRQTSWPKVPLGNLGQWSGGGTPSKANAAFWTDGTIPWVSPKDMKTDRISETQDYITEEAVAKSATHIVRKGAVVVVARSGILRHSLPVAIVDRDVTLNQDLKAVELHDNILPEYVAWAIRAAARDILHRCAKTGTTVQNLEIPAFLRYEIPLAPLDEQRRIVAVLETQLTRLDASVTSLKRVQANLKRYRASVLKAACEGRIFDVDAAMKSEWTATTLGKIAKIVGGLTKNPKRLKLERQLPYLRVANVYANELRLDEVEHIGVADAELEKLLLKDGDLLMVEGNGSKDQIGRVALWDGLIDPCVHQNHLIKIRLSTTASPKWVLFWLLSPQGRKLIEQVSSSTSGLYTLSVGKVAALPVSLPVPEVQHRIVAEVERRLSVIERLEATVAANLKRAERLRQAVLSRTFSG